MTQAEMELTVRELRNSVADLEQAAERATRGEPEEPGRLLDVFRNLMGAAARMAPHLGLTADLVGVDEWRIGRNSTGE